ncbi:MAG: hypothetical protein ABSA53_35885 [Streptosporangiaceae bacterium]
MSTVARPISAYNGLLSPVGAAQDDAPPAVTRLAGALCSLAA